MLEIGERIKNLRTERALYQKDVAAGCDVTTRAIRYYEAGERELPSSTITKLCLFFNVSADYLLGLDSEPRPLRSTD